MITSSYDTISQNLPEDIAHRITTQIDTMKTTFFTRASISFLLVAIKAGGEFTVNAAEPTCEWQPGYGGNSGKCVIIATPPPTDTPSTSLGPTFPPTPHPIFPPTPPPGTMRPTLTPTPPTTPSTTTPPPTSKCMPLGKMECDDPKNPGGECIWLEGKCVEDTDSE